MNQGPSPIDEIIRELDKKNPQITAGGLPPSAQAYLLARVLEGVRRTILVVVPTGSQAERMARDLSFFLEKEQPFSEWKRRVFLLPNYEVLPFQGISPPVEVVSRRLGTLYVLLSEQRPLIVVTSASGAMQKVLPRSVLGRQAELVISGEEIDREALIKRLVEGGYFHTSLVEQKGDLSVRGDLLDLFPPNYEFPVRLEFFGDYVESIRLFDVASQRSFADLAELVLLPVSEIINRSSYIKCALKRLEEQPSSVPERKRAMEHLRAGHLFPGVESLMPFFYPRAEIIADYLQQETLVAYVDPAGLRKQAAEESLQWEHLVAHMGDLSPYMSWSQLESGLAPYQKILLPSLVVEGETPQNKVHVIKVEDNSDIKLLYGQKRQEWAQKRKVIGMIEGWLRMGMEVGWVCQGDRRAQQLYEALSQYELRLRLEKGPFLNGKRHPSNLRIFSGELTQGFKLWSESLVLITDEELYGPKRKLRPPAKSRLEAYVSSFEDLKVGDLVVHAEHGIGRYQGLVQLTVNEVPNDFLLIQYQGMDRLYIPVHNLKMIQKYVGVEGHKPRLDKLGGKNWAQVKKKVKRNVEKLARELLEVWAARSLRQGFAFSPGNGLMRQFEEEFPYEETPDQQRAIEEVMADMEDRRPMDRLVCGDVGYGKTEVAMRAAFKCVLDGKQVCFLVPTTVLAAQHYQTFRQRFRDYPVEIRALSRFQTPREQKEIIEGLQTGRVDIVIGTHRLLQKDVSFRDLGLLIVDEEQRFGVAHKERIKKLKKLVDVLTLTATPIPRTLHMALMGIRDLSTIETPPRDRLAIKTYLAKFDDRIIKGAIERELNRGGQVFFVHNRVQSIEAMARHIQRLVPQARVGVAHGQLKERELERVMMRFLLKEIDVLVCTVIIESGLDIPSANTIIINQADRFGLAQIYQLRGRVGRSKERAYAYLLISGESSITEEAKKRLKVLMDFTELGAGFKIAFHDLQIRGGGEIFGPSQSGHIAAVGYEMYLQLMEKAINELKGGRIQKELDPEVNLHVPAFIPETYIPSIDQRLSLYKRISSLETFQAVEDMYQELADRFGKPPQQVLDLLEIIRIKIQLRQLWIRRLDFKAQTLIFNFEPEGEPPMDRIIEFVNKHQQISRLTPEGILYVKVDSMSERPFKGDPLQEVKKILQELR